jgi:hypothetical protein
MGTRINVILSHDLPALDCNLILSRLAAALPAALAVRNYWLTDEPRQREDVTAWGAEPILSCEPSFRRFTGPGSLFLTVAPRTVHVRTGGRWRGFLTIEPLRSVHMAAFRQLAQVFGSGCFALFADSCEVDDAILDGQTQWQCIELMERMWGAPQASVETIEPRIAVAADQTVPLVWFLETTDETVPQVDGARS